MHAQAATLKPQDVADVSAYLAGVATEQWTEEQVRDMWREDKRYEPDMSDDERQQLLSDWRRALERSRRWVVND